MILMPSTAVIGTSATAHVRWNGSGLPDTWADRSEPAQDVVVP